MGHKKRHPTSHRKLELPPSKTLTNEDSPAVECERALHALRRGNHNKALRIMKDASTKFENSALFHRVAGTVSSKVAFFFDDVTVKNRHMKNAVNSARNAVILSPNSIEYSHFYANLLFDVANDEKDYEEVKLVCERALSIVNPNDPALDELNVAEREEAVLFSDEAKAVRVAELRSHVKNVIHKANFAPISCMMKNFGPCEDRIRFIAIGGRPAEDPVEVRYLSGNGKRSNEIKKATKTVEERRKEIEVRVAAARLLQQKTEMFGVGEECNTSGSVALKVGEVKRRYGGLRRSGSISEMKQQVRSFWNSMSVDMKKVLLSVRISDLKVHLDGLSSKDGGQVGMVFSEALAFSEMNQTWKFWLCFRCGERFADTNAHIHHVHREHIGTLSPRSQSVLPQRVDSEWEEMLMRCSWEPLDLVASVRMLEDPSKPDSVCSSVTWESFYENIEDSCNGNFWENGGDNEYSIIECKTCDKKVDCRMYNHNNSWPLSNDSKCAKLLKKIKSLFQMLLRQKCLSVTHLDKVICDTMEELHGLFPGSQILSCGVDQTPLCICFLGASPLRKIVDFLQTISNSCCFGRNSEKVSVGDTSAFPQVLDFDDRITLNVRTSCLQLDESLLHVNGVRKVVGSGSSSDGFENSGQSDSDPLLCWIYAGPPSAEQLATWSQIIEERTQEGVQLVGTLTKEYMELQILCQSKQGWLGYEEALQKLEELCLKECKKREKVADITYRSCKSILLKRKDELAADDNKDMLVSKNLELDAISTVLKEAESHHASQYGYEDSYGGEASHFCDLEAGEEDWRSKDYLQELDRCTETVFQIQKKQLNLEVCKLDAQILHRLINMNQLEHKLEPVSALDYRFILLPLLKSFIRAHIEDLAEKDATEKSDAAREAFLAKLALDSKKCTRSGNDSRKNTQEKMKDKKKNKDLRRIKDFKFGGFNNQLEAADQFSPDGDHVESNILELESYDNMRALEDEFQRKSELEADARKLEETLEYQRRMENEAKQRLLAEQQRRNAKVTPSEASHNSDDVHVGFSEDSLCKQVTLPCKSDSTDSLNSPRRDLKDGICSRVADEESVGSASSYLKPGLLKNGGPSDGLVPLAQQGGKRGKRRNSTKVTEDKNQIVPYVKENTKLQNSIISDVVQNKQAWSLSSTLNQCVVDGGSKTVRQLQVEGDEEERFQADLQKAVMQSLDTYQTCHKGALVSNSGKVHKCLQDFDNFGTKTDVETCNNVSEMDFLGPGLQNEAGEYNCFLNVIIQSLWRLRQFREEFLRRSASEHVHVGDPCVVCALFDILTALNIGSGDANRKPVAPSMLRIALKNLYPENNFFQEGEMNDASEVLGVIFECLHRSFTLGPGGSDSDLTESNVSGSWDCSSSSCIAHTFFGMNISERMNCPHCGLESRHLKYTSFFYNVNASALRTMKVTCKESSFDVLLDLVERNHQLACDLEAGGCGKLNHIHHILSNPPHVFTAVLGWQNTCESLDDIKATLEALSTEIDISTLYRGLDPQNLHRLVSVVCYYGQHYHCFAYSHDHERWVMYDDTTVKVIGTWEDIFSLCERGHLQPQVFFFEAVN